MTAGGQSTGRLISPVTEADYELADTGGAATCGRRAARGRLREPTMTMPNGRQVTPHGQLLAAIGAVSTATLASQLKKRGYDWVVLDRLQITRPELKMSGFARTVRYVPYREDLFKAHSGGFNAQKQAVEQVRDGEILVIEARGDPTAGTIGDILALRTQLRGARGIVTDGAIRDSQALRDLDIPVYYGADQPRGARPAARPVGDQRDGRLRRRHYPAGRHPRRRRRRRRRHSARRRARTSPPTRPSRNARNSSSPSRWPTENRSTASTRRPTLAACLRSLAEGERMRFRSDPAAIRGSIAPLVSPFTADGQADLDGLRALIRWQLESGSHGISLGGSTGEPSAQTTAERAAAIRAAAAEIGDRVPFVPGTGSAKLDETLELTAVAADVGADAVLIITPYYARPTQEGLFQWYARVAGEFPGLPVIVYNVPSRTAVDIAPETIARLRKAHDNIVGVKETTKDFEHFSRVLHVAGTDTLLWSGIELLCLPLLSLGGVGFVSGDRQSRTRRDRADVRPLGRGRVRQGTRAALRPASGDRCHLHRDQPCGGEVGTRAGRAHRIRLRPAAARAADRRRPGQGARIVEGRARPYWKAPSPRSRRGQGADHHRSFG